MKLVRQPSLFKGARKPMRIVGDGHSEHKHQAAFITWRDDTARLQKDDDKREALLWLHAIPNGSFLHRTGEEYAKGRTPAQALKLKAEGVKPGVWDLRLDYVLRDEAGQITCPGLIIEMKSATGYLSKDQKEYGAFMLRQGYRAYICRSWQEAARAVIDYMGLTEHAPIYP